MLEDDYRATYKTGDESSQKIFGRLATMAWHDLSAFFECFGPVARARHGSISASFQARGATELVEGVVEVTTVRVPRTVGGAETLDLPVIARIVGILLADGSVQTSGRYYVESP